MDFADRIVESYLKRGFKLVEKIPPWRFFVAVLEKNDQKYFLKVGEKASKAFQDKPLNKMWPREEKFVNFTNAHLEKSVIKPPFRLVKFYERDQDEEAAWTLQEYLENKHIFEPSSNSTEDPNKWLPTITRILHWFDKQDTADWGPLDRDLKEETIEKLKKWSKDPLERGILSPNELEQALKLVDQYYPHTEIRLQHGDFVPWHMHDDGFPNVVLIDLEGGNLRFRYYDLAYIYHRLFTKRGQPSLAKALLDKFLETVPDREEFKKAFIPSLVNRAVGGLQDYCNEYEKRDKESNDLHLKLQRQFLEKALALDLS